MSCTIQNYGFTKNGQWVDSNCRALITDNIACKANIYFDSAVGDIYLWFNVRHPDNTVHAWRYNYTISSSGTVSIDVGMGTLAVGNYYINSVVVTDKANTYQMCSASGTPNNCRSLSVTGGGTSYDCINRNCLLRQDTQGFFSDYSTCNRVCEVKSVDFQVVGNGQMYIEVNNVPTVTVFPGETKPVTLRKGNQLRIILTAYVGNHLVGLCDVPQTECRTDLGYYLDILDANVLPQKMVATFAIDIVTPTKYNCVNNQCQGPYTSGTYNSLVECQAVCKPPTATKYNCVSGACQGPFVTGQFNSLAECQAACTITQKWKCINPTTNACAQAADGTFDTEVLCKAATSCQPTGVQTWYCNTSTKICSLQSGSGGYATKAVCDVVCSSDGGGTCPSDQIKDTSGNCICIDNTKMNILGTCYKKNDVYMAVGAVVLLMVLTKK